jgi:hypothetical protein
LVVGDFLWDVEDDGPDGEAVFAGGDGVEVAAGADAVVGVDVLALAGWAVDGRP